MVTSSPVTSVEQRRLVFRVGGQHFQIDAAPVIEIIRSDHLTRVPHGPNALAGLANLRGRPLPVLSIARMFGIEQHARGPGDKIVVYERGGLVGLLVDDVSMTSGWETSSDVPMRDIGPLLDTAFDVEKRAARVFAKQAAYVVPAQPAGKLTVLLTFRTAAQLYGLPLQNIREITTLSSHLDRLTHTDTAVLGMIPLRDGVLPIVSLVALLGIVGSQALRLGAPIIVIEHENDLIGIVVDKIDAIHRLPGEAIDVVPPVLQKGHGDAKIDAIGRVAGQELLISILSPEKLFGHAAVSEAVVNNAGVEWVSTEARIVDVTEQFLIFQLGTEFYGLSIAAVDEVIRVPNEITRLPGAPIFVSGVINLRGRAVPLIDQRLRFESVETAAETKARAIVVTVGALQVGFVVDGVSEVRAISKDSLSVAPEFSSEASDVFDRVAQLEPNGKMVLLVNPQELLTRAERDVIFELANNKSAEGKT